MVGLATTDHGTTHHAPQTNENNNDGRPTLNSIKSKAAPYSTPHLPPTFNHETISIQPARSDTLTIHRPDHNIITTNHPHILLFPTALSQNIGRYDARFGMCGVCDDGVVDGAEAGGEGGDLFECL
jgi:hypothetical protein